MYTLSLDSCEQLLCSSHFIQKRSELEPYRHTELISCRTTRRLHPLHQGTSCALPLSPNVKALPPLKDAKEQTFRAYGETNEVNFWVLIDYICRLSPTPYGIPLSAGDHTSILNGQDTWPIGQFSYCMRFSLLYGLYLAEVSRPIEMSGMQAAHITKYHRVSSDYIASCT